MMEKFYLVTLSQMLQVQLLTEAPQLTLLEKETRLLLVIRIFGMTLLSLIQFLSQPQLSKNPLLSQPLSLPQSQLLKSQFPNLSL